MQRHLGLTPNHPLTPDLNHLDRCLTGKRGLSAEMSRRMAPHHRRHASPAQRQATGDDCTESTR